ncbi:MAG: hypothetical protein HYZ23_09825 [Chloroflexi bacterium]|nr:hypothetical protein [Chloroflexota bacterium]
MTTPDSPYKRIHPETKMRVRFAALSGLAVGTIAAITSSFINIWLFPDLPLYIDWPAVAYAWALWAALGGILAGLAALSSDGWKSILLSAFGMTVAILILNFIDNSISALLNFLVLLGLSLPFTAMLTPLAFLFFWLGRRFVDALDFKGWASMRIFIINFMVIAAIGAVPGMYMKMNARTELAIRIVHDALQSDSVHRALAKTEGFAEHRGQPHTLSHAPSAYSTVGVDVTAHYDDGYTVTCVVVMYSGYDPSVYPCRGGIP